MKERLLIAVTDPMSALLVRGQLSHLAKQGYSVSLLSSPGSKAKEIAEAESAQYVPVSMAREIAPWRDFLSFVRILREMHRLKPRIVNASTPKASLLVLAAAFLLGVPRRIHTLRGLRSDTCTNVKRLVLTSIERLVCKMSHRVICISPSLRNTVVARGIAPVEKCVVIGAGSSNGVSEKYRHPPAAARADAERLKQELFIADDESVLLFVGRVVRDKGIEDLTQAWSLLRDVYPRLRLIVVGPFEAGGKVSTEVRDSLGNDPRVTLTGMVEEPLVFYLLAHIVAIPSHREGFGNALLEANAVGRPVVGCRVTGCVDAVEDGVTATLVPPGNPVALAGAIERYLNDPALAKAHGEAGRLRANALFRPEEIWRGLDAEYECKDNLTQRIVKR